MRPSRGRIASIAALCVGWSVFNSSAFAGGAAIVGFRLELADAEGSPLPVELVSVGDDFRLNVFVQDLRGLQAAGIFAAYLDIDFDRQSPVSLSIGEAQTIKLSRNMTGGEFTLAFEGAQTAAISLAAAPDAIASSIRTALAGLPT